MIYPAFLSFWINAVEFSFGSFLGFHSAAIFEIFLEWKSLQMSNRWSGQYCKDFIRLWSGVCSQSWASKNHSKRQAASTHKFILIQRGWKVWDHTENVIVFYLHLKLGFFCKENSLFKKNTFNVNNTNDKINAK